MDDAAGERRRRTSGFIGEPIVNLLELNLAMDEQYPFRG